MCGGDSALKERHETSLQAARLGLPASLVYAFSAFPLNTGRTEKKFGCELSVDASDKVPVSRLRWLAAAAAAAAPLFSETPLQIVLYLRHTLDDLDV